jgi:hypothetical protein
MFAEATLETAIPRPTFAAEQITFQFSYTCEALSLEPDIVDIFFFEVSKPTRSLEISLHLEEGLFCQQPKMIMGNIEEVMMQSSVLEEENVRFATKMVDGHGRILTINYPQSGRYGLFLNTRHRDPTTAATA